MKGVIYALMIVIVFIVSAAAAALAMRYLGLPALAVAPAAGTLTWLVMRKPRQRQHRKDPYDVDGAKASDWAGRMVKDPTWWEGEGCLFTADVVRGYWQTYDPKRRKGDDYAKFDHAAEALRASMAAELATIRADIERTRTELTTETERLHAAMPERLRTVATIPCPVCSKSFVRSMRGEGQVVAPPDHEPITPGVVYLCPDGTNPLLDYTVTLHWAGVE